MASLLGLSRAEQERSKRLLRNRLFAHGVTLLLGLVSLLLTDPWVYVAAVAALVSESVAWWLRSSGLDANALAEGGRRRALIERELGRDADSLGTAQLMTEFSDWAHDHAAQWDDASYYGTTGTPGPDRLRLALQESAFWSSQLYRAAARQKLLRLAGIVGVIVLTAILVGVLDTDHAGALAARAATVALATLVTVDELSMLLSLFSASKVADRVVRQLDTANPNDLGQMLVIFADYSVATALGSPIPTKLYLAQHDRINAVWHARVGGGP